MKHWKEECLLAKARGNPRIAGHDYDNANPRFGLTWTFDEVFGKASVETVGMRWLAREGERG